MSDRSPKHFSYGHLKSILVLEYLYVLRQAYYEESGQKGTRLIMFLNSVWLDVYRLLISFYFSLRLNGV
ncbi:hypothetical protein [Flavivirga jejuensis]|uniref:Uncharacterized protein n=1 Tax=Flavivirga jejuensis TaxID=870487 RepID=A0ABT8WPM2_9FLAO|nr:hypothetical protein [Flavivirga jejuensis]MDO5975124.1 hypothetical protein [Flavivirga jejuensis]